MRMIKTKDFRFDVHFEDPLPCVSISCTRTDFVYLTRSDRARDNLIVFLFLKGELYTFTSVQYSTSANTKSIKWLKTTFKPYFGW